MRTAKTNACVLDRNYLADRTFVIPLRYIKNVAKYVCGYVTIADPSGRSLAGTAGSNPASGISVCLL